jgi:hypothetical protein
MKIGISSLVIFVLIGTDLLARAAILRMKVERGPAALERFKKIAFQTVFKEEQK